MTTTQSASPSAASSPTVLGKLLEAMQRWWHRDSLRRHGGIASTDRRMGRGSCEKPGGRTRSLWEAYLSEPFVGTD